MRDARLYKHPVSISMDEVDYGRFLIAAGKENKSLSRFIRDILNEYLRGKDDDHG